ncbi:MAG: hypothetical protein ACFCU8_06425 [Thermosynechococcaceae cyanobacterium]
MLKTIEGIYRDGVIQLAEVPSDIAEGRVIVTFLETSPARPDQIMRFGMFTGVNLSTLEDFQLAEFHGDSDDSLDWR